MIHWSPKSERTSVQNCHSYLTYIFHIITTLGDSIFQTLQRIMRVAFASRGIIQILQWALLIFIITTSGDLFYFYLRASLLDQNWIINIFNCVLTTAISQPAISSKIYD